MYNILAALINDRKVLYLEIPRGVLVRYSESSTAAAESNLEQD